MSSAASVTTTIPREEFPLHVGPLPPDAAHPADRGSDPVALPPRRDLRHDAPLLRPGGGRGRSRARARGARPGRRHLPWTRARAGARRRSPGAARRDARTGDRDQRRPRRLDEHQLAEGSADRLVRDRRRHDRRGDRSGARPEAGRGRCRVPVRRRRDEPGLRLRVPQLLRRAQAAGRVPLREQPLRRVHALRGRHRGGHPRATEGDGGAVRAGRRDERSRDARGCRPRRRPCALGSGAVLRRGADVPLRRALAQRPGRVPARGRARRMEGPRPDPAAASGARRVRPRGPAARRRRLRDGGEHRRDGAPGPRGAVPRRPS